MKRGRAWETPFQRISAATLAASHAPGVGSAGNQIAEAANLQLAALQSGGRHPPQLPAEEPTQMPTSSDVPNITTLATINSTTPAPGASNSAAVPRCLGLQVPVIDFWSFIFPATFFPAELDGHNIGLDDDLVRPHPSRAMGRELPAGLFWANRSRRTPPVPA